jgi:hypothetical protein
MTKTLIVAALLSSFAAVSFAQDAASAPEAAASASHKHMKKAHKAHRMHKAASAATNPEATPDKKGGN